jgi:hypothetical protein
MKTSLGYAVLLSKFEAFEYKQNGGILQGEEITGNGELRIENGGKGLIVWHEWLV